MKLLINFFLLILPSCVFAGVSGGGVGPRPGMDVMTVSPSLLDDRSIGGDWMNGNSDLVRSIGHDRSSIVFQIGQPQSKTIQTIKMRPEEFSSDTQKYLDALNKSAVTKKWEPVTVEGLRK